MERGEEVGENVDCDALVRWDSFSSWWVWNGRTTRYLLSTRLFLSFCHSGSSLRSRSGRVDAIFETSFMGIRGAEVRLE